MKSLFIALFVSLFSAQAFAYTPYPVTSSNTKLRTDSVRLSATGGSCAIATQTGNMVASVTPGVTGICTLNFTASFWSSTPFCQCLSEEFSGNYFYCVMQAGGPSTTNLTVYAARDQNGNFGNAPLTISCQGQRP